MNDAAPSLLRSNIAVASGTAMSRLTGLLRVVVFAMVIGRTSLADAYNSANQTPNAIYELLLGGVLSASLVPLFTRQAEDKDDEGTSAVITIALLAVAALTLISVLAAPWIFRVFAVNVSDSVDADLYRAVGTSLARIFLIQILFYGVSAVVSSLLNAHRRFFAAAWAPVLSNIVIIGGLLLVPHVVDGGKPALGDVISDSALRWTLGLGATAGIAVMAIAMVPALRATGVNLRWNPDVHNPSVKRLTKLSVWTLGYVLANQVAVIVVANLAQPGSGQVDAYSKAYTVFVLPHGLLAVSIATTFEPEMARSVKRRQKAEFIDRTSLGVRLVALLAVPAGLLLFTLRRPIIGLALQHRRFTALDALITSRALGGFALGLVGFSVYLFTLRAFYSHGDARTPFVINVFENVINIVLAIVLVDRYGVLGLGLSFAIAYLVASIWALNVLSYKVPGFHLRPLLVSIGRMLLAGAILAEVSWAVAQVIGSNSGLGSLARVTVAGTAGVAAYVAVLTLLGAPELHQVRSRLLSRFT